MSSYLDVIKIVAATFEFICITLKPRENIQHADALAYLAKALEDDSPKKIYVDSLQSPNISWIKSGLRSEFHSTHMFFAHKYK